MLELTYQLPSVKRRISFLYPNQQIKAAKLAYANHAAMGHNPKLEHVADSIGNVNKRSRWDKEDKE